MTPSSTVRHEVTKQVLPAKSRTDDYTPSWTIAGIRVAVKEVALPFDLHTTSWGHWTCFHGHCQISAACPWNYLAVNIQVVLL